MRPSGAARVGAAYKARAQAAMQAWGRRAGRDMVVLSNDLQLTTSRVMRLERKLETLLIVT